MSKITKYTENILKFLMTKSPRIKPMRSLLFGIMAVCGRGMPSGCLNKTTTANQSAMAPTIDASAKARTILSHGNACSK